MCPPREWFRQIGRFTNVDGDRPAVLAGLAAPDVPTPPISNVEPNISLFDAIRLPTPTIRALSRQTALSIASKVDTYIKKCRTRHARRASRRLKLRSPRAPIRSASDRRAGHA